MRLSDKEKDERIIELYKAGHSYRQIQKRYHRSPNYVARLVKRIKITCSACGKPKGKVRFHAHHPDRINLPDYTIPLCPSCHPKEEAKLRSEKETPSQSPLGPKVLAPENNSSEPETNDLYYPPEPL